MNGNGSSRESWHLDKRFPVALILALVMQTGGIVWWAATLQASDEAQDGRISRLEQQIIEDRQLSLRLARFEERMEGVREDVADLKQSQSNVERMLRHLSQGLPGQER